MRISSLVLALCLAGPVHALSCLPWHVEDAYREARDSQTEYVVIRGQITFALKDWPATDFSKQEMTPAETRVPAQIDGMGLTDATFDAPVSAPLEIVVQCAGPWCPSATPGATYLAFVEIHPEGLRLDMSACRVFAFESPDAEMVARVLSCHAGGECQPPTR
jgi:hypothetical protein